MPRVSCRFPPSFPQGRRPLLGGDGGSDRRQEPEPLSWGPQFIPSPGGQGPEGAGRGEGAARRSSEHLSQPARAQVKLRVDSRTETPGRLPGGGPRSPHTPSRLGVPGPDRAPVAQAARVCLPRLTRPFPAPVPATPTGLCRSLRVARSLQPKYRETSRGEEGYCGKGLTFFQQFTDQQVDKKTPRLVRCWPIPSSGPPKAPPNTEDRPIALRLVSESVSLSAEEKDPSRNTMSLE